MSNLSWVPRINITKVVSVTPTITGANYASGMQVGGIMTLTDVVRYDNNTALAVSELVSVSIFDKAKQDATFDIWFFSVSPTLVSVDRQNFDITDANALASVIGAVTQIGLNSGGTSNYSDSVSNSICNNVNLNLPLSTTSGSSLYAVAIVRGTPTFTSTSDLTFKFGFFVD